MADKRNSLKDYALRWMRLGNYDLLTEDNPYFVAFDALRAECRAQGKPLVSFAHYDYLGIADHPDVLAAGHVAIDALGMGVGASRLVGGERSCQRAFEQDLARFIGMDDALTLVGGYATNVTVLGHILGAGDLIVVDELSHNSILAGTKLSRARIATFRHNDCDDLEALLAAERGKVGRVLIVVEGLYSMDGDIPDLPRILEIRDRFDAWVMVDEAHSIGVVGTRGRGIAEHFGVDPHRIDLVMGTLSKTFVTCGGFVAANRTVIEWLRFTLPGFIYSVGIAPPTVAASHAALSVLEREPERVSVVRANAQRFRDKAHAAGLDTGDARGYGVVPVIFDTTQATMLASRVLLDQGIYVPPIVQIGVPKNKPRLRFFISARHTASEIDRTIDCLAQIQASLSVTVAMAPVGMAIPAN